MNSVLQKSVVRKLKAFKGMVVLGLGVAVTMGFGSAISEANLRNPPKQACCSNAKFQDSDLIRLSAGEKIIMARRGNRSGSGSGKGQKGGGNWENRYQYDSGDEARIRERYTNETGDGPKKGARTGDCDGTGLKRNGPKNRTNQKDMGGF